MSFRFHAGKNTFLAALVSSFALASAPAASAQINLTAGDVALIGWVDNGSPNDAFAIVALADLPAGTTIYFTDNGWSNVTGGFRNTNGPADGNGNETLMALTVSSTIPAGTILDSTQTGSSYAWVTSGAIPGATSGTFGYLVLTQSGDQIYAFQQDSGQNPMNTGVQQHLFVLDDTGTFEDATTTGEGNVPPGLSVAGNTALTFNQSGSAQNFMAFNTSSLPSGTKATWLAAIHDPANWTFGSTGTLPSGSLPMSGGSITPFCFGDGSLSTACPCGNSGVTGHGCENSAHTGGGMLAATGSPSPDTLVLHATSLLPTGSAFFQQTSIGLPTPAVFGDGVLCTTGVARRLVTRRSSGGSAIYPGTGDPSISARSAQLGDTLQAGDVRYYQVVYRDPNASFCPAPTGSTFNVTNAVQVVW